MDMGLLLALFGLRPVCRRAGGGLVHAICAPRAPPRLKGPPPPRLLRLAAPAGGGERRFAAGEAPAQVIADIHARHHGAPAPGPSIRTLRRWFNEGRWLGFAVVALKKAARAAAAG